VLQSNSPEIAQTRYIPKRRHPKNYLQHLWTYPRSPRDWGRSLDGGFERIHSEAILTRLSAREGPSVPPHPHPPPHPCAREPLFSTRHFCALLQVLTVVCASCLGWMLFGFVELCRDGCYCIMSVEQRSGNTTTTWNIPEQDRQLCNPVVSLGPRKS
jgi:hypothetical protein